MSRSLLIFLLLLAVIGTSVVLWNRRTPEDKTPPKPPTSDYILEDYQLVALDEEGKESFRVTGPQLQREPGGKSLELTLPVFSMPDKEGKGRWTGSSRSAWVAPNGDEVRLIDDVLLRSPPDERQAHSEFRSASLKVFPKQDRAETADTVRLTSPGAQLSAVGFKVDMNTKRYSLLSQVKGRYETASR